MRCGLWVAVLVCAGSLRAKPLGARTCQSQGGGGKPSRAGRGGRRATRATRARRSAACRRRRRRVPAPHRVRPGSHRGTDGPDGGRRHPPPGTAPGGGSAARRLVEEKVASVSSVTPTSRSSTARARNSTWRSPGARLCHELTSIAKGAGISDSPLSRSRQCAVLPAFRRRRSVYPFGLPPGRGGLRRPFRQTAAGERPGRDRGPPGARLRPSRPRRRGHPSRPARGSLAAPVPGSRTRSPTSPSARRGAAKPPAPTFTSGPAAPPARAPGGAVGGS